MNPAKRAKKIKPKKNNNYPSGLMSVGVSSFNVKMKGIAMIIEHNPKELAAMEEFHKGNRQKGLELQEEFAAAFRKEYKDKDHCPCKKACRYHGNCKECVAIHRAHQEHVPNCMRPILNQKIKLLSELTEHTIAEEIQPPQEVLRKEFL